MTELAELIEHHIPEGRQSLENGYANLEHIAAYCEANYIQATDKKAAFEETKRLTVQSLASVAYQINALASNVLSMLDLQTQRVLHMETQLNNISQIVDIHKEKVARREIGVLTTNKANVKQYKIITPARQEKPKSYIRRNIDYSILDDLGHGVRIQAPQNPRMTARAGSTSSNSSGPMMAPLESAIYGMNHPTVYLSAGLKTGTISRATNKEYKVPVTVAPPTAPTLSNEYVQQRYPGMIQTNQNASLPENPQMTRFSRPTVQDTSLLRNMQMSDERHVVNAQAGGELNIISSLKNTTDDYGLYSAMQNFNINEDHSPPLPPPPPMMIGDSSTVADDFRQNYDSVGGNSTTAKFQLQSSTPNFDVAGSSRQDSSPADQAIWVPQTYMEKVMALYDYQAEKADELSFYENQIIYVLKKNEDGWFEGVLNGVTGLFPGNYVEPA